MWNGAGITRDLLAQTCLAQPEAIEDFPFGEHVSVFKVGGKTFALIPFHSDKTSIMLKCDPGKAELLRQRHPAVRASNFHKMHWNHIFLDRSIALEEVREWIEDSYDLVVDKLRKSLKSRLQTEIRNLEN